MIVCNLHGKTVSKSFTSSQRINCAAIYGRVRPVSSGIHACRTVAGHRTYAEAVGVDEIDIVKGDLPGNRHAGGNQTITLRHRASLRCTRDRRCIVGACNGHAYSAGNGTAASVQYIKAEGFDLGLALSQVLDYRCSHAVIPGNDAATAGACGVRSDTDRQAAQCINRRRNSTDAMHVSKVYISKPNRATVSEHRRVQSGLRNMQLIARSSVNWGVWISANLNEVGTRRSKYM